MVLNHSDFIMTMPVIIGGIFSNQSGIDKIMKVPNKPQFNSRSEHINITLINAVLSSLFHSN